MPYKDPEKQRLAQRDHARRKRAQSRAYQTARRAELQAYVQEKKRQPCTDCGGVFPPVAMDYHHARGDKSYEIAKMVNGMYAKASIDAEIVKCDLVCANCHRVRHG